MIADIARTIAECAASIADIARTIAECAASIADIARMIAACRAMEDGPDAIIRAEVHRLEYTVDARPRPRMCEAHAQGSGSSLSPGLRRAKIHAQRAERATREGGSAT